MVPGSLLFGICLGLASSFRRAEGAIMFNPIIESCAAQLLSLESLDLDESIDADDSDGLLEPLMLLSLMIESLHGRLAQKRSWHETAITLP